MKNMEIDMKNVRKHFNKKLSSKTLRKITTAVHIAQQPRSHACLIFFYESVQFRDELQNPAHVLDDLAREVARVPAVGLHGPHGVAVSALVPVFRALHAVDAQLVEVVTYRPMVPVLQ